MVCVCVWYPGINGDKLPSNISQVSSVTCFQLIVNYSLIYYDFTSACANCCVLTTAFSGFSQIFSVTVCRYCLCVFIKSGRTYSQANSKMTPAYQPVLSIVIVILYL